LGKVGVRRLYCVYVQYFIIHHFSEFAMPDLPPTPPPTPPPARLSPPRADLHPGAAAGLPAYAELFCLSNFSFLQGASHAEELVDRAVQLGYAALAVTDECSLAGVVGAAG
jgi:hypothetical protein